MLGTSTVGGLTACLTDTHTDRALGLTDTVYTDGGLLGVEQRRCQRMVGRVAVAVAAKRQLLVQRCKARMALGFLPERTDCIRDTGVEALLDRLSVVMGRKILALCPDAVTETLSFGGRCEGRATGAGVTACALCAQSDEVDKLVAVEYGSGPSGLSVARRITDAADCVDGPLSRCRLGDYLLANDQIRVVVQDIQRNMFGIGQFGGQIIDADLVREAGDPDRDHFEEWAVSLNIEATAHYTALTVMNDGGNGEAAIIRATGVDDLLDFVNGSSVVAGFGFPFPESADDVDLPLAVMTDYILEPGRDYVRVETTVQNIGATTLKILFGEPLVTQGCRRANADLCNFPAYSGHDRADGISYGYVNDVLGTTAFSTDGVTVPLLGIEVVGPLLGFASPNFTIAPMGAPGDSLTFTRHFVVGDGSVSSITDARNALQCLPTGRLAGTVTVGDDLAARADISILGNGLDAPFGLRHNVVTYTRTDDFGRYELTLPPGDYTVVANLDGAPFEGGEATPLEHPVTIDFQTITQVDVELPLGGAIRVFAEDETNAAIAARASVVGFDPSPPLLNTQSILGLINIVTGVFGDRADSLPFGVAGSISIDHGGDSGVVPLEPGSYRVVVSHGPEHSISETDIAVVAEATTNVDAQVERVVDTMGFIAADFHVHAIDSPDSEVSREERVITMLTEGVDFFTPSDHDIRVDFQPTVAALGVTDLISTATGSEITSFDYGHINTWPMTIDPNQINGGSIDHGGAAPPGDDFPSKGHYSLTPAEIIEAVRADPGTNTVHISHMYSHFGLDAGFGLAIDTALEPPQSTVPPLACRLDPDVPNLFTDAFDALEIWIGDSRGQVFENFLGQNIGDWFNLMNQGILRTAVADSDTHRLHLTQSGVPRSMVASPTDDPGALGAIADMLSASVNAGRVVGTNAPMVRVETFAGSTGQRARLELGFPTMVETDDGAVDVIVEVQSPLWAQFDRIEYYVNTTTIQSTLKGLETGAGPIDVNRYGVVPEFVQVAGVDFAINTVPVAGTSSERLEATSTLHLNGLTEDTWVVVVMKGTDGVSRPLFPVVPNDLSESSNTMLADLTDGNLGEEGITALAFTNPLFIDVDGGGWIAPGVRVQVASP